MQLQNEVYQNDSVPLNTLTKTLCRTTTERKAPFHTLQKEEENNSFFLSFPQEPKPLRCFSFLFFCCCDPQIEISGPSRATCHTAVAQLDTSHPAAHPVAGLLLNPPSASQTQPKPRSRLLVDSLLCAHESPRVHSRVGRNRENIATLLCVSPDLCVIVRSCRSPRKIQSRDS